MKPIRKACVVGSVVLLMGMTGCGQREVFVNEYGKVSGQQGAVSVNGTSVLYEMFRQTGHQTRRAKRISPRLDRYGTVIWFPDNYQCPDDDAVEALDQWLQDGYGRTLVYVGRDYTADVEYFEFLVSQSSGAEREKQLRNLADAKVQQDSASQIGRLADDRRECRWFELNRLPRRLAGTLTGKWAERLQDATAANVEISTVLQPRKDIVSGRRVSLLEADGEPFAWLIEDEVLMNQFIIVSNGSFLLNYGLMNVENRKLAGALIAECDAYEPVLFLESGPSGIPVSNSDTVNHNAWAWIAQPPLKYIVPHFLMWGVLYCFVYFPIFGRPKHLVRQREATFRQHVVAMGKLFQRTRQNRHALNKVEHYKENIDRESHLKNR